MQERTFNFIKYRYMFQRVCYASLITVLILLFSVLSSIELKELIQSTSTGKFLIFSYAVVICSVLWALQLSKRVRLSFKLEDTLVLSMFLLISINRYYIQDEYSFSSNYYELIGLIILYGILRGIKIKAKLLLYIAVLLGGIIQSVYGQLQLLEIYPSKHDLFNLTGSFFNPGPYAGYLASVFPIAVGFFFYKNDLILVLNLKNPLLTKGLNHLPGFCVFLIALIIIPAQSRAAWLGVIVSSVYLLYHRYNLIERLGILFNTKLKKQVAVVLSLIMITAAFTILYDFKRDSGSGRMLIWKVATPIVKENPFFGVGFDRFQSVYMNFQLAYFAEKRIPSEVKLSDNVAYAFNEPIQFLIENGIFAFILLMVLGYLLFKPRVCKTDTQSSTDRRVCKPLLMVAQASILSIGVFSLFSYPSQVLPIKINLALNFAVISTISHPLIHIEFYRYAKNLLAITAILIALIGGLKVHSALKRVYNGYREWGDALSIYQTGNIEESLRYYTKIYPLLSTHGEFLMNYGKALSMTKRHVQAVSVLSQAKKYRNNTIVLTALGDSYYGLKKLDLSEQAYINAWYMVPSRIYPKYLLAKLFAQTGQHKKATITASEVLSTPIKIKSKAIIQMISEVKKIKRENENKQ